MNKKLMAVAIIATLSPLTALADAAGVTLYGVANVAAERVTGLASDSRASRLTDSSSRIGIRGAESLGSGLEGFFQIETLVAPEGNNGNGGAPLGWASRNSGVGLRGGFGEILAGRWDAYYNDSFAVDQSLLGRSGLAAFGNTILGFSGNNAALAPVGGRYSNVIRYSTPNLAGFKAGALIGSSEEQGGKKQNVFANYANGPIYAGLSFITVGQTAANLRKNKGIKGMLAYTFPSATKVGFTHEQLKWDNATGEITRNADLFTVSQNLGAVDLTGSYGKAKALSGTGAPTDSGAKYLQLTGAYSFSKRTLSYLSYIKVDNETNAAYNFFAGGAAPGVTPGIDPKSVQLGIHHSF
jgi:predicted porin